MTNKFLRATLGWFLAIVIGLLGFVALIAIVISLDPGDSEWTMRLMMAGVIGVCALGMKLRDKLTGRSGQLEDA